MTVSSTSPAFHGGWGHAHGLVKIKVAAPLADLDQVRDRLAIEQVTRTYGWCIDEQQFDVLREIFTEDMAFRGCVAGSGPFEDMLGRDVYVPWLENFMAARTDQMRHNLGNVVVTEQTPELAKVLAYMVLTSSTPQGSKILATAFYEFTLVKRGEYWQISALYTGFDTQF